MSIKNWYDGMHPDDYALSYNLSLGPQTRFLSLFMDFREFCRFFFLDDMIDDKDEVIHFCPKNGKGPLPKDVPTYMQLLINQRAFVDKRNIRMKAYIDNRYNDQ